MISVRMISVRKFFSVTGLALLTCLAFTTTLPHSAYAGSGSWTRVSSKHGSKVTDEQIGLVRRSGGALGVAWVDHSKRSSDLKLSTVSAAGKFKGAKAVVRGWKNIGGPDAVPASSGGARILFSGRKKGATGPSKLRSAWALSGSSPFKLEPNALTSGDGISGADIGASVTSEGDLISSWASSVGVRVHYGLGPTENYEYQHLVSPTCCAYSPDIASTPGSGGTTIGWYSGAAGHVGVYAASVNRFNGSPINTPPLLMPGTKNASLQYSRTPITGRPSSGGTYMAYPAGKNGNEVRVWRVGSKKSSVLARVQAGASINGVGIAADPKNRLWVFWGVSTIFGGKVYASRSDLGQQTPGILTFAKPRKVALPKGGRIIDQLYGNAQRGKLDLVAKFRLKGTNSWWHRQVKP